MPVASRPIFDFDFSFRADEAMARDQWEEGLMSVVFLDSPGGSALLVSGLNAKLLISHQR